MSLSIKRTTTALATASLAALTVLTACDDSESGASSAPSFDTVDAEEYTALRLPECVASVKPSG